MVTITGRAKAQRAAIRQLQTILDPGSTIYWIERRKQGTCDEDHIYLDPVALSGGLPIYLRELVAVLGPYPLSADVPALVIDDTKDPEEALRRAMSRIRRYVHTDIGIAMPVRWL